MGGGGERAVAGVGDKDGVAAGRRRTERMARKGWETEGAVGPVPGPVPLETVGTTEGGDMEWRLRWRAALSRLLKAKEGSGGI